MHGCGTPRVLPLTCEICEILSGSLYACGFFLQRHANPPSCIIFTWTGWLELDMQNMTIYTVHFQKYGWNPEESSMLPARKSLNSNPFGGGTPNHPKLDNFSAETCWNQWWLWDPSFSETRRNPEMFRMFPPCEVEMARTRVPCRPSTVPWIPGRHSWVPNNVQPWIHTLW